MPKRGYRKDESARTSPVTFSLPGYILDALDAEMEATGEQSRSRLLVKIIDFWLENRPAPAAEPDYVEEDLARFRAFYDMTSSEA